MREMGRLLSWATAGAWGMMKVKTASPRQATSAWMPGRSDISIGVLDPGEEAGLVRPGTGQAGHGRFAFRGGGAVGVFEYEPGAVLDARIDRKSTRVNPTHTDTSL